MIRAIVMGHRIPAGALGPGPVQLDVRAYLVAHASGVILVDTGMDAGGLALGEAGAAWPDVSHVLIAHAHRDHVGALDYVRQAAPAAAVMASPVEGLPGLSPLADRDVIGPLRVFASPGHTPGHLSFADEERGVLLVGDCASAWWVGGSCARPSGSPPISRSPSRPSVACLCGGVPGCFSRMARSWPAPGMSWIRCWNAEKTGAVTLPERCGYSVRFVSDGVTTHRPTAPAGARESR